VNRVPECILTEEEKKEFQSQITGELDKDWVIDFYEKLTRRFGKNININ
jgi:hypothetical protein